MRVSRSVHPVSWNYALGLVILFALLLAACGGGASTPAATTSADQTQPTSASSESNAPAASEATAAPTTSSSSSDTSDSGDTTSSSSSSSTLGKADFATVTPPPLEVAVEDQDISGGTVTVARVTSDRGSWLVIRADNEGKPGAVLGHAAVSPGTATDVVVEIDTSAATETLFAALHVDAGKAQEFEYPGGYDINMRKGNEPVITTFMVTGGLP